MICLSFTLKAREFELRVLVCSLYEAESVGGTGKKQSRNLACDMRM